MALILSLTTTQLDALITALSRLGFSQAQVAQLNAALANLEIHMSKQDDQVAEFETQALAQLVALGTSLDGMAASQVNIAADEAKILAQLKSIPTGDLTPENAAKLAGVIGTLTAVAARSATQAAAFQTLADSLPDEVPAAP